MLRRQFLSSFVVQLNSSLDTFALSLTSSCHRWYSAVAVSVAFSTSLDRHNIKLDTHNNVTKSQTGVNPNWSCQVCSSWLFFSFQHLLFCLIFITILSAAVAIYSWGWAGHVSFNPVPYHRNLRTLQLKQTLAVTQATITWYTISNVETDFSSYVSVNRFNNFSPIFSLSWIPLFCTIKLQMSWITDVQWSKLYRSGKKRLNSALSAAAYTVAIQIRQKYMI